MARKSDEQIDARVARMHRDYLHNVVAETKKQPTTIAKLLNISPSTLTRIYRPKDGQISKMSAGTLARLEEFSGLAAPSLEPEPQKQPSEFREDATRYEADAGDPTLAAMIATIIGNKKNIDPWVIRSRSLECAGFMPGDVVLVDLSTMPRASEPACAQVYNWRGGTAETVMRILEPPYLVAATFDPALRKPLLVDDDRVIVKGLILPHRLRPRPN
ncbi:hypothetical protein RPPS3_25360 [Rhodopseudomonas palustris]|uniref:hypothetical protein n=1 Tax=Rhodopseudomonas palustris TaxID=1076 RepID=UPI000D1986E7|nr:hypothetical protein [Rhodopseudomonas palustris]AVT76599.1 hypothetical protein RPPS3_25360 [Rhodopseudomonas palustris]